MRQDEKDPSWWGPSWGLIPHGRGGLGDGERPAFVEFEPGNFLRLYQTAHSESTGISGITRQVRKAEARAVSNPAQLFAATQFKLDGGGVGPGRE